MKKRLLFLCGANSCRSQMAEGFARAIGDQDTEVVSAGLSASLVHPLATKVMAEAGIDISQQKSKSLESLGDREFDLVITLCGEAAEQCPMFPGAPTQVHWGLRDPALAGSGEDALPVFRSVRDDIRRLVSELFEHDYLTAMVAARRQSDLILNSISDGIIAHDMNRRIFFFNKRAQEITGYPAREVLGRDCHDVFPGNLCGGKCKFCDGQIPDCDTLRQELTFVTRTGDTRLLDGTVTAIKDLSGKRVGHLMAFADHTRERALARRVGEAEHFSGIVGRDRKMLELFDLIRDLADTNAPVLIHGESGTGKELVAAAIHNEGPRANRQFVPVNCGALPETLLESELFGYVRGAFTGAVKDKKGRFELADGGTIFLDEIGDISPAMQVKLMRVLQEGTFERVGSERTLKVDVRVISATNKDIRREIAAGRFRDDLFYRLSVVPLHIPPLRDRRNDIPLLAEHILKRLLSGSSHAPVTISQEAMDAMLSYAWPGNVRELQNWIQFALVKCKSDSIMPSHFPPSPGHAPVDFQPKKNRHLDEDSVKTALRETGQNRVKAAKILGVSRATLYRFLDKTPEIS